MGCRKRKSKKNHRGGRKKGGTGAYRKGSTGDEQEEKVTMGQFTQATGCRKGGGIERENTTKLIIHKGRGNTDLGDEIVKIEGEVRGLKKKETVTEEGG